MISEKERQNRLVNPLILLDEKGLDIRYQQGSKAHPLFKPRDPAKNSKAPHP